MRQLLRRAWYLIRRRRFDADLREELEFHRASIERELQDRGTDSTEARFAARRAIGSIALAQDQAHDVWTPRSLQGLWQDVRVALRGFRATKVVTAVAVLSLTLAIGATTAVFGLLNAVVFRPLAIPDPYSLVRLAEEPRPGAVGNLAFPAFREFERDHQVFTSLMGFTGIAVFDAETPQGLKRVATMGVTANFYAALDVQPFAGRLFAPGDFTTSPLPSAILGYGFWERTFGADPSAVGKTLSIDGIPLTIIGIAPKRFSNLNVAIEPAVTVPLTMYPRLISQRTPVLPWTEDPNVTWVTTFGRLAPGVTLEQARSHVLALWPPIRASVASGIANPDRRHDALKMPLTVQSAATGWDTYGIRSRFTTPFYVILGIAALILLIACVNVASLMLSRAAARQHEIAIRVALGASRGRLVRQMLVEGLLLSMTAAIGGIGVATAACAAFPSVVFANAVVPMSFDASPDPLVLGFACVLAIVTAGLFSLAPIWRVTRHETAESLQRQHRTIAQTGRIGRALVAVQIALCLMLVAPAGLLVRSLEQIRAVDSGVRTDNVLVAYPAPLPGAYQTADNDSYYPALLERVRSLPGVQAAGISQDKPLGGQPLPWIVGVSGSAESVMAVYSSASPGLFDVLGIPVLAGRDFTWSDNSHGQPVAVVSSSLAHRLFGDGSAIGRQIRIGPAAEQDHLEVVGVIGDARTYDVKDDNVYAAYIPSLQRGASANGKALVMRGSMTARDVNEAIAPLGREYVGNAASLDGILDNTLLQERLTSAVAGFFGILSLVLSAIGLYGLMAYSVVQRRHEIAIRMALGGRVGRITGQIVLAGLRVACAGVAGGFAVAWMTTRFVGSLLFKVEPHDLLTMGVAPVLLLVVAVAACLLPAYRAARVHPASVLRNE